VPVNESYQKYLFWGFFLLLIILSFFLVKPYFSAILGAVVLSYIFYPLFIWLKKSVRKKAIAALLVIFIITLIVAVPVAFIGAMLYNEASVLLADTKSGSYSLNCPAGSQSPICLVYNGINERFPELDIQENSVDVIQHFKDSIYKVLLTIPNMLLQLIIMLFIIFFLLVDAEEITAQIKRLIIFKKKHEDNIILTIKDTMRGVVYGQVMAAIGQGFVAALGFWLIAKIDNPVLWGLVTAFFSLIPVIGSGIIWGPISIYLIGMGVFTGETGMLVRGIVLLIYGLLIVSTIDNVIKTKLISSSAKIHPVIVLIGVLGGLSVFGIVGIFLGPIVLALLVTFTRMYIEDELS
jgi:predicted PurR-regulated permease PerM